MKTKGYILIQRDANKWPGILETSRNNNRVQQQQDKKVPYFYRSLFTVLLRAYFFRQRFHTKEVTDKLYCTCLLFSQVLDYRNL